MAANKRHLIIEMILLIILSSYTYGLGFEGYYDPVDPIECTGLHTFEDDGTYLNDVYVSTTGSDSTGDGSSGNPYATLSRAAQDAQPGDIIHIAEGSYSGGLHLNLEGTAENPIQILGEGSVEFVGGSNCIQFSECKYLVVRNIKCRDGSGNGFNVDDGGNYDDNEAAAHIIFDDVEIYNIGAGDNEDNLKLSGINDFYVLNSNIHDGSSDGSCIDMVGCHDGIIIGNRFENCGSNVIQTKGGSEDVTIHGNYMKTVVFRAVNMGGSTNPEYYRPPISSGTNYDARHIRVTSNIIIDAFSAVAYVGCDECLFANNVIYKPRNWVLRILQEITSRNGVDFISSRRGEFVNNIIVFDSTISRFVNIGPDTEPESFRFANNLWYCDDNPDFDYGSGMATLPTVEINPLKQQDPLFADEDQEDFHIEQGSPAADNGETGWVNADFDGLCFNNEIGAFAQTGLWRFAVAGDTRSGHSDHAEVIAGIINKIPNSERVTVFNTGDVTADGIDSQWQTWEGIVEPLDIDWGKTDPPEYIGAVGNHDTHQSGWQTRWANYLPAQAGLSAYSDITAHSQGLYGSVKYDNAIFVWVDSDSLPSGQDQFLEDTLSRASQDQVTWKFVFFHHPPIPCSTRSDWSKGKEWHDDYFVPYDVDIVFLGHDHYYMRTCPITNAASKTCDEDNRGNSIGDTEGVVHIVAGGGGAPTYTPGCTSPCSSCPLLEKGEESHHFLEVEVQGQVLSINTWDTDVNGGDNPVLIETFTIDKQTPEMPVPQNLAAVPVNDTSIDLSWTYPDTVDHYNIYRDNTLIGQSTTESYSDTGLTPDTTYTYRVSAVNTQDQESPRSSPATATTLICIDNGELKTIIDEWLEGSMQITELMQAIIIWKQGCE